jgi:hypothetical protein
MLQVVEHLARLSHTQSLHRSPHPCVVQPGALAVNAGMAPLGLQSHPQPPGRHVTRPQIPGLSGQARSNFTVGAQTHLRQDAGHPRRFRVFIADGARVFIACLLFQFAKGRQARGLR